jgi:hypothetical protein
MMRREPAVLLTPGRRAITVHAGPQHSTRELRQRYGRDERGTPLRLTIVRGRRTVDAPV